MQGCWICDRDRSGINAVLLAANIAAAFPRAESVNEKLRNEDLIM
jgi:hypothetical protein